MNYRHIYHAGNFADVFKHVLLIALIEPFKRKEKPFCVLDTHAGLGRYDLTSIEAEKTREAADGIELCINATAKAPAFAKYLEIVRALNPDPEMVRYYPGSPWIARAVLRPQDRLVANELHPDDAATLRYNLAGDSRTHVHHGDGYAALKSLLPPVERRGLVLVDPPFEKTDELDRMIQGIQDAERRFATGTFAFWYPIKERRAIDQFHRRAMGTGIREILAVELSIGKSSREHFLGTGLLLIRPPYGAEPAIREVLPELLTLLRRDETAHFSIKELVPQ
jgi:23S rRNA (adenine2030-N6)-methyltransferase